MKRGFTYSPPKRPVSYIYVDQDIIIAEKPCGLLSVPGKTETDCMEARIRNSRLGWHHYICCGLADNEPAHKTTIRWNGK